MLTPGIIYFEMQHESRSPQGLLGGSSLTETGLQLGQASQLIIS